MILLFAVIFILFVLVQINLVTFAFSEIGIPHQYILTITFFNGRPCCHSMIASLRFPLFMIPFVLLMGRPEKPRLHVTGVY